MHRGSRRALAALLSLCLIVAALLPAAMAEDDWRSQLRAAFGLDEAVQEDAPSQTERPAAEAPGTGKKASKNSDKRSGESSKNSGKASKQATGAVKQAAEDWTLPITEPQRIVNYLNKFGRLPDNFITKKEARALGWDSAYNYVGDMAPGKSIGGDRFGNYEGQLPKAKGRVWYECDTGYAGKRRGACRLLFSSDGLYYYTSDHYNTFTQMFPED